MARELTASQTSILTRPNTRPIFLVELDHGGGVEYLSAVSAVQFDGNLYSAGGVAIKGIQDSDKGMLELVATDERVSQLQQGLYRGGLCRIWCVPAYAFGYGTIYLAAENGSRLLTEAGDLLIGENSAEDLNFILSDGVLMLEGVLTSSRLSGDRIMCTAEHGNAYARLSPRYTVDAVTSYSPAPGTVIEWEGELYSLEARR